MVNNCGNCDYLNDELYCERLGVECRINSPICEFYVKRGRNGKDRD